MVENPYQSPQSLELADLNSAELDPRNHRGRGPLVTTPVGFLLGSVTVAIAGALGAATLGFFFEISSRRHWQQTEDTLYVMAIVGGGFGLLFGAIWGAGTGLSVGISPLRKRNRFVWTSSIVTGLYGAGVGFLGGLAISFQTSALWVAIGMVTGAVAGSCGGWSFIQLLAWFCWGKLGTKHLPEVPTRLGEAAK